MHSTETILSTHNLTWSYDDTPLLNWLNLEINKGDFVIIQWASGSGKTTLMKLLTGNLPAQTGQVFRGREDISRFSDNELQAYKKQLGLVFQNNNLLSSKNVADNITYPLWLMGHDFDSIDSAYRNIVSQLWIAHLWGKMLHHLSGGEKQKVSFARAMIKKPTLMIADEPTWNLDRTSSKLTADLMISAHKLGHTMIVITHDLMLTKYITEQSQVRFITLEWTQLERTKKASSYTRGSLIDHTITRKKSA